MDRETIEEQIRPRNRTCNSTRHKESLKMEKKKGQSWRIADLIDTTNQLAQPCASGLSEVHLRPCR